MSPRFARFDWDEANLAHIARHDVTSSEVEETFLNEKSVLIRFETRVGELRYTMLGPTAEDRLLLIVFMIRKGKIRVVTAYTASRKDRATYTVARSAHGA